MYFKVSVGDRSPGHLFNPSFSSHKFVSQLSKVNSSSQVSYFVFQMLFLKLNEFGGLPSLPYPVNKITSHHRKVGKVKTKQTKLFTVLIKQSKSLLIVSCCFFFFLSPTPSPHNSCPIYTHSILLDFVRYL